MSNLKINGEIEANSMGGGMRQLILELTYPVGTYFINDSEEFSTVEKVQAYFGFGEWVKVEEGRFIEAGSNITTHEAGLPNITGSMWQRAGANSSDVGAIKYTCTAKVSETSGSGVGDGYMYLDASKSNSIYGNSDTVQPKSRTAYIYYRIS